MSNKAQFNIPENHAINVCFGGGVDSTAMLCLLKQNGIRPEIITFADTGAEKPETYEHVRRMDKVLDSWGFPRVTWCKKVTLKTTSYSDLEGNCVDNETLPSLAFGMKSCSIKWKQGPQDQHLKGVKSGQNKKPEHALWTEYKETGRKIVKLIGYDSGPADLRRSKKLKTGDAEFLYRYPLQSVGWAREDCVKAIVEELGPSFVPIKSACFFCPASKQWELFWLAGTHPDLFERCLVMEYNALTGHHSRYDEVEFGDSWENMIKNADSFPSSNTTVGLGRSFAWNMWARKNNVTNNQGRVIADPADLLRRADELRGSGRDNAQDFRTC
jgi:hypothetical protein